MEKERFSPSLSSRSQVFFAASKERALNAQRNPENHAGMTVRVGGFSAVFVNVGKDIQDEVISRRRHVA